MSSNLPLVRRSHRVLPFLLCIIKFSIYGQGGHKLEINIPPQQIFANSKGGGAYNQRGREYIQLFWTILCLPSIDRNVLYIYIGNSMYKCGN